MSMREMLKQRIKKLFENTESTITNVILLGLLGGSATILAVSKKALSVFLQIITTPTPLWATILLGLLGCLYTYLKLRKNQSSSLSSTTSPDSEKPKIAFFTVGDYKWRAKIYPSGYFDVDKYPFCKTHDIQFIYEGSRVNCYCPEVNNNNCESALFDKDKFKIYESAKSYIEKEIRNNYIAAEFKPASLEPASASSEPEPRKRLFDRKRP